MTARRWLAVCGIAAAVLFAVGTAISGGSPQDDASASKVVSYYRDHLTGTKVGALILVIAAVLLVLFAARLRELLRNGQPGGDVSPIAAFGGAVLLAAGSCLDAAVSFALAQAGDNKFAGAAQTLNVVSNNDFFLVVGGIATLLLATGNGEKARFAALAWLGRRHHRNYLLGWSRRVHRRGPRHPVASRGIGPDVRPHGPARGWSGGGRRMTMHNASRPPVVFLERVAEFVN